MKHIIRLPLLLALMLPLSLPAQTADFTLTGLDGKTYSLSDYRGKWVLVNYWATWCPPCREELPELEVFYSNHKDKDAVVLGIALEDISDERLKAFVDEQFLSYPIIKVSPDRKPPLGTVPGLPTSYLVNPEGKIVAKQVGALTREALESFIETHNAKQSTPKAAKAD